jgi:plasmid stabilization system protein ParE
MQNRDNTAARRGLNDAVAAAAGHIGANPALGVRPLQLAGARDRFWSTPRYSTPLAHTGATDPPRIVRMVHTLQDLPRVLADFLPQSTPRISWRARRSPETPSSTGRRWDGVAAHKSAVRRDDRAPVSVPHTKSGGLYSRQLYREMLNQHLCGRFLLASLRCLTSTWFA